MTVDQIDRVDPELLPLLQVDDAPPLPITRETLNQVRARSAQRVATRPVYGTTQPRLETITTPDGGLDLYIFEPHPIPSPKPCLIWLHGGGYIMGQAMDMWNGPLFAERTGCTVVSVEYRLAPEHPFPAGLHDASAALNWVQDNAVALGIDGSRIAIGGASAGAGLAAGLALYTRDQGGPDVCFQLLLYPMLDNLHDTPSGRIPGHPIWSRADSFAAWDMYLDGTPGLNASPYAAPSRAVNMGNLPPAFISVGDVDLFLDENADFAARLKHAGGTCRYASYPGVFHSGEVAGAQTRVGKQMIDDYVAALQLAFA